jgi:hypothetical protein
MIFSGSKNNMYGLIEGMETKDETKDKDKGNILKKALQTGPMQHVVPGLIKNGNKKDDDKEKSDGDTFQVRKPVGYADIVESKSDTWNLSNWVKSALRYSKGMGNENKLDSYKYHTGPKIPLPEGQLFFFNNTKFDSECCPSTYSSSRGCACLSQPQYNHLMMRGGNHTPPKNTNTAYFNEF